MENIVLFEEYCFDGNLQFKRQKFYLSGLFFMVEQFYKDQVCLYIYLSITLTRQKAQTKCQLLLLEKQKGKAIVSSRKVILRVSFYS